MYKVLIVEPQEFSLASLLNLPVWKKAGNNLRGFECIETASNGQEALDKINKESFDLILTEINLPLCDGLQLLKKVHVTNQPPLVVFISDIVTFAYAREGFIYGAFDYLPKPVSEHDIESLFQRAAEELERLKKQRLGTQSNVNIRFNPEQVNKLLSYFDHRDKRVLTNFDNMIHSIYETPEKKIQHPDMLASKLFFSLIEGIYSRHKWIELYIPRSSHEQIDYLEVNKPNDYLTFYQRKLTNLFDLFCGLNPDLQDDTLVKVYLYLLNHPEEELRLVTIAGKFYINHTYLSNLFSRKSPLKYSQLVSLIKMHRAEYLINFTTLPLEDIASKLGYKDFRYFLKLFREIIGKSASDYIRNDEYYSNYSI